MQVRHVFSLAVITLIAVLHFAVQWFAWKVHLFEIPMGSSVLGPPGDYLWTVCSWPMFEIVPRRVQHLHFLAILLANSFTWGAVIVGGVTASRRFAQFVLHRRRKKRAEASCREAGIRTAPPTRMERIIELNAQLNLKRITEDEYRAMRKAIMREQEPEPDVFRPTLAPNVAVTYSIPAEARGADHVAWIDNPPRGVTGKRPQNQTFRLERDETPLPTRRVGRKG
jgi:hypothetical protein